MMLLALVCVPAAAEQTEAEQPAAVQTETTQTETEQAVEAAQTEDKQTEAAETKTEQAAATEGTTAEAQEAEEQADVQYVMYLGTNDKDTNKPVFTEAESLEQAKDILIRHFGGYTIQEAHGGWISDGKVYQEYTLVIYLSDTTLDKVHAAAEEMIKTFNQSSILIHANQTKTEYFSIME